MFKVHSKLVTHRAKKKMIIYIYIYISLYNVTPTP